MICGETAANHNGSSLRETSMLYEMCFLKEGILIQSPSPDWIKSKFPLRSRRLRGETNHSFRKQNSYDAY